MAAVFKYYIHDTVDGLKLEMFGALKESAVGELSCCWQTAKTTLKGRTLTLDLRNVTEVDESAKQWLASLEGAKYLPESFLLDAVGGLPGRAMTDTKEIRQSLLGRILRMAPKPAR
jgi:hypothetical protein